MTNDDATLRDQYVELAVERELLVAEGVPETELAKPIEPLTGEPWLDSEPDHG